jgi:MFS family permease
MADCKLQIGGQFLPQSAIFNLQSAICNLQSAMEPPTTMSTSIPARPTPPASTPGGYLAASMVVLAAALVMAATIPGRTQGLALVTSSIVKDIPGLSHESFAWINFWGTLIGGLFCVPCGWLLDRIAPRIFAAVIIALLGFVTLGMSLTHSVLMLMVLIALTRGLGQSMLSVISLTLMAKWFRRDSQVAMGSYAVALTLLMVVGFGVLQSQLQGGEGGPPPDWRAAWWGLGIALVIIAPLAGILASPVTAGRKPDDVAAVSFASATMGTALGTGCFWAFSLSISLFGLVSSGVTLYQEDIFATLDLDVKVFHNCQLIGLGIGLLSNFLTGWLARKVSLSLLLGMAMSIFAASLMTIPFLRTPGQAYLQAVVFAFAGGAIVVLFYLIWVQAFGPKYVGEIQGVVQWMTVIASAFGPPVVIVGKNLLGGYPGILWLLAAVAAVLAVASFFTNVPLASRGDWSSLESRLPPAEAGPPANISQETV